MCILSHLSNITFILFHEIYPLAGLQKKKQNMCLGQSKNRETCFVICFASKSTFISTNILILFMLYFAISCYLYYHVLSHAIMCRLMLSHAITFCLMLSYAISCNLLLLHDSSLTCYLNSSIRH